MKSNALSPLSGVLSRLVASASTAAGSPATQPAAAGASANPRGPEAMMLGLVSLGLCALAVWVLRRLARPGKVSLAGTPGRPNTINPAHVLVVLLVWLGSGDLVRRLLGLWLAETPHPRDILTTVIEQIIWLTASLVVAAVAFRHGLRSGMGLNLRHWLYDMGRGLFAYLAVLPICFGLFAASKALYWAIHHAPAPEHQMLVAIGQVSRPWQVLVIISAVVLAPLAEEVFCRGLLQSMFRRYTGRPWVAVMVTAGIFAMLHWNSVARGGSGWVQLPPLFALGVVLGYNYERSGRLIAPIVIHVLFNGVSVGIRLMSP